MSGIILCAMCRRDITVEPVHWSTADRPYCVSCYDSLTPIAQPCPDCAAKDALLDRQQASWTAEQEIDHATIAALREQVAELREALGNLLAARDETPMIYDECYQFVWKPPHDELWRAAAAALAKGGE